MPLSCNLGTLTSWNPLGPSGPVTGLLYPFTGRALTQLHIVQSDTRSTGVEMGKYNNSGTFGHFCLMISGGGGNLNSDTCTGLKILILFFFTASFRIYFHFVVTNN